MNIGDNLSNVVKNQQLLNLIAEYRSIERRRSDNVVKAMSNANRAIELKNQIFGLLLEMTEPPTPIIQERIQKLWDAAERDGRNVVLIRLNEWDYHLLLELFGHPENNIGYPPALRYNGVEVEKAFHLQCVMIETKQGVIYSELDYVFRGPRRNQNANDPTKS